MSERPVGGPGAEPEAKERGATSDVILDAAFQILASDGYQGLTARRVAEEAGTNLALVNYYFGGKKGMLLALYDRLERARYDQQQAMYANLSEPLSVKWRRALDFYRQDLSEGFVRVHHELQAQGMAEDDLARRARERVMAWREMLEGVAVRYLPEIGLEVPAEQFVTVLAAFWFGMEQHHLLNVEESEIPYFALLEGIGEWLEAREAVAP